MSRESVRGTAVIVHLDGGRCIHSRNKPCCDGSHRAAGLRSDG